MKKLFEIQKELKCSKDKKNDFGKFNYRNVEQMLSEIKNVLDKHNAVLTLNNELLALEGKHFIKTTATYIDLESEFKQSATAFAGIDFEKKGMDYSQACGAAQTYCSKYALNALFLIDDGSLDADSQPPKGFEEQTKTQPKPTPTPKVDNIGTIRPIIHDLLSKDIEWCNKILGAYKKSSFLDLDDNEISAVYTRAIQLNKLS